MTPYQDIDAAQLAEIMASNQAITLLDVRNEDEVARGIIQGAIHIPLSLLPNEVTQLDADKPMIIYCHSGIRSGHAAAFLANVGYEKLYNLRGGILAWAREGYNFVAKS